MVDSMELNLPNVVFLISIVLVLSGFLLSILRLVKGPFTFDRLIALDAMTIITLSLIVSIAHFVNRFIYIDVALVYGLLSFLGVLAISRYKECGWC